MSRGKREENPSEKWFGDMNICGSFIKPETFHIYSSGNLMYLQPVFRAFVACLPKSPRVIFSEQFSTEFALERKNKWEEMFQPEIIIRSGALNKPGFFLLGEIPVLLTEFRAIHQNKTQNQAVEVSVSYGNIIELHNFSHLLPVL